jgi:hypothetical protein
MDHRMADHKEVNRRSDGREDFTTSGVREDRCKLRVLRVLQRVHRGGVSLGEMVAQ